MRMAGDGWRHVFNNDLLLATHYSVFVNSVSPFCTTVKVIALSSLKQTSGSAHPVEIVDNEGLDRPEPNPAP